MASSRSGRVNVLKTKIDQLKNEHNISREHIDSILKKIDSSLAKLGNEKNFKKHFLPTIRLTDQLNRILLELNLQLEELSDEDSETTKNNVPSTPTISSPSTPHQSPRREREVSQSPRRDLSKLHTNRDRELCKSPGSNNHTITERKVSKSPKRDISNHHTITEGEVSKSSKRDIYNHHTITEREVSKPPRRVVSKDDSNRERELPQQQRLDSTNKSTHKAKEVSQQSRVDSTYKSPHPPKEVSTSSRTELATYHNLKSSEVDNTEMGHRKVMEWNLNFEAPIRKVSNQKIALTMGSPEFIPSKFELEYKSNKDKSSDTDCENQQPRYRNTLNEKIGADLRYQSATASGSGSRFQSTHNLEIQSRNHNVRPVYAEQDYYQENQGNTRNVKPIHNEPDYKQRNQEQNRSRKPVYYEPDCNQQNHPEPVYDEADYNQKYEATSHKINPGYNQENQIKTRKVKTDDEPDYKLQNHKIKPVGDKPGYNQENQIKTHKVKTDDEPDYKLQNHKIKPVGDKPVYNHENQIKTHRVKTDDEPDYKLQNQTKYVDESDYNQQNQGKKHGLELVHDDPELKQDNRYLRPQKINAEVVKEILDAVCVSNSNLEDQNRSDSKQEKERHRNDGLVREELKYNKSDDKALIQIKDEGNSYYSDEEPERLVSSQSVIKLPLNDEPQEDQMQLAEGDTCIITHVNSPSCFYILIASETIQDYDSFHEQLHNYCESDKSEMIESKEELKSVNYVCCYNEIDYGYKWFRCIVTSLLLGAGEEANKVLVMAVDDGFEIQVELSNLRKYPKLKLTLPHMAIKCSLLNLSPPTEKEWPTNSIEFFDGIVRNSREQPFTITAVKKKKDGYAIDLINNMESNDLTICKVMEHMEFAKTCDSPVTNPGPTTDDLIITSDFMKEQILQAQNYYSDGNWENLDDCEPNLDVAVCNQMEGGYTPKDFGRLCRFTTVEGQACFKGDECQFEHRLPDQDGWTRDQIPVYTECINKPLLPESGTKIKIIVTYVKSITSFYGHLKMKRTEKNSHIVSTPNEFSKYINKPDVISKLKKMSMLPALGQLVLAKLPTDQKWYRGRVISIHSEEQIDIFFIDYGDMGIVPFNDIREIELQHLGLPEQAIMCHLNLQPNSDFNFDQNRNAVRYLSNLILDTTVVAVVKSNGSSLQLVQVHTKKQLNLCDHLIKLRLASTRDTSLEINYNSQKFRPA